MEFFIQITIFTYVCLALVPYSAATLTPEEVYWNDAFPNTPMPKGIQDLIRPEMKKNTSASPVLEATIINDASKRIWGTEYVWSSFEYAEGVPVIDGREYKGVDLFFLERAIRKGGKLNILCADPSNNPATFLPREDAERVPFDSKRITDILNHFSMKPNSQEAKTVKQAIAHCERHPIQNEQKYCATSLESMIDHSISKLGKNIRALTTDVEKKTGLIQRYNITEVTKIPADIAVSCHQLPYVHLFFYCHNTGRVRLSMVSLVSVEDGTKVRGVAICHMDSKYWNPNHLAFRLLKVKPGTVPVCHFLYAGHVLWVRK